jgi:hypothetical protein
LEGGLWDRTPQRRRAMTRARSKEGSEKWGGSVVVQLDSKTKGGLRRRGERRTGTEEPREEEGRAEEQKTREGEDNLKPVNIPVKILFCRHPCHRLSPAPRRRAARRRATPCASERASPHAYLVTERPTRPLVLAVAGIDQISPPCCPRPRPRPNDRPIRGKLPFTPIHPGPSPGPWGHMSERNHSAGRLLASIHPISRPLLGIEQQLHGLVSFNAQYPRR